MALGSEQERFASMLPKLIQKMESDGYKVRIGDVWAHDVNGMISFMENIIIYLPDNLLEQRMRHIQTLKDMRHSPNSCHYLKIAADINLFKDGAYLTKTEDHKAFGEFWESLGGTWGGRFGETENGKGDGWDANHYSIEHLGFK